MNWDFGKVTSDFCEESLMSSYISVFSCISSLLCLAVLKCVFKTDYKDALNKIYIWGNSIEQVSRFLLQRERKEFGKRKVMEM